MSKVKEWMKILSHVESPKLPVQVGDKCEQLTHTQAYRLAQINAVHAMSADTIQTRTAKSPREFCSLIEASFQTGMSESELAAAAAAGRVAFYVDAAGFEMRQEISDGDGSKTESEYEPLTAGYLVLATESCKAIAEHGVVSATSLLLPFVSGAEKTVMTLRSPQRINRSMVLVLKSQLGELKANELSS